MYINRAADMKISKTLLVIKTLAASLLLTANLNAAEVCVTADSDPDGDGFGWEQEATCLVVVTEDQAGVGRTPAEIASQSIVYPRTGERVEIERIFWQVNDFADRTFTGCQGYVVDPAEEQDQCLSCGTGESYQYQHYSDGNGRLLYSFGNTSFEADFTWGIDENSLYFGPMPVQAYAEITNTGINQWLEGSQGAIGFYEHCEGLVPSIVEDRMMLTIVDEGENQERRQ